MSCKIDLRSEVIDEANSQGVPPEVALAVATQESGLCHWSASGAVKRGTSGEYGIMQLMPATAAALGVDPTDVNDNIHGGVKYLRQLYDRYRDWAVAVQHYNGSGPAARAYAVKVMAIASQYGLAFKAASAGAGEQASPVISKNTLIGMGIVVGAGLFAYALAR